MVDGLTFVGVESVWRTAARESATARTITLLVVRVVVVGCCCCSLGCLPRFCVHSKFISKMTKNTINSHVVTVLVETPLGRTASATVPATLPYDSLLERLWDAALARDAEQDAAAVLRRSTTTTTKRTAAVPANQPRSVRRRLNTYMVHEGRILARDNYQDLFLAQPQKPQQACGVQEYRNERRVSLRLRLLGGIDRQNRVGSKFGGGGVSSSQNAERERKERLKRLALESIDLAKDPYLMRNHLGTYECKLCLTIHPNEANYLSHTQGKKHQQGLARRAFLEKQKQEQDNALNMAVLQAQQQQKQAKPVIRRVRIGRPAYQVLKSRDVDTNQRCLSFELSYPEINVGLQPRHRFMSAFEQRVDTPPDRRYQYLLIAAEPYETVAFKIPNEPIDKGEGRFVTHWDLEDKKFTLTLYYMNPTNPESDGTQPASAAS